MNEPKTHSAKNVDIFDDGEVVACKKISIGDEIFGTMRKCFWCDDESEE